MKKTKKWIFISIVFLTVAVLSFLLFFGKDENKNLEKETVVKNEIKKTVSVTGSLISKVPVVLNFENPGRVKEIKAKIGDKVVEGDVIAVLDEDLLNEQVKKAKAVLDKTRAEVGSNNDLVREAEEKVDNAEDYLEAVEEYHNQLVDSAEIAHQNAEDYLEDVENYYDKILADSGAGSSEELSAKLTLTTARNSEKIAEEALKTAKKNRSLNLMSAENSLELVEENLKTVQSDYSQLSLNASIQASETDYRMALDSLEKASLKSPLNGVISKINYEEGEVIGSASGFFGEIITDDFVLKAEVPEADISQIELGQMAEVTFDSFNYSEKFQAEVIEIEPASTKIQELVYYKIKLVIDDLDERFKEGMSADVDILIDFKKETLVISDQFIIEENNKNFVNLLEGNNLIRKEIKIGLKGDQGYTEVLSGLKVGEEIYYKEN